MNTVAAWNEHILPCIQYVGNYSTGICHSDYIGSRYMEFSGIILCIYWFLWKIPAQVAVYRRIGAKNHWIFLQWVDVVFFYYCIDIYILQN